MARQAKLQNRNRVSKLVDMLQAKLMSAGNQLWRPCSYVLSTHKIHCFIPTNYIVKKFNLFVHITYKETYSCLIEPIQV